MSLKDKIEASPVVFLLGALIAGFSAGVGAYKAILEIAQLEVVGKSELATLREKASDATPPPQSANPGPSDSGFLVKLTRVPDSERLASLLRQIGYDVNFVPDEDGDLAAGRAKKENYSVISVGSDVPARFAAKAIRLTHNQMPWVRYVFLQYQRRDFDRHILLNAHDDWVPHLGLKSLSDADFDLLSDERLTAEEFHKLIHTFKQ